MNIVLLADTVANYDAVIVCFENTPATTDDKSTFAQSTFYYSYKRQSFSIRLANEYTAKRLSSSTTRQRRRGAAITFA